MKWNVEWNRERQRSGMWNRERQRKRNVESRAAA